MDGKERRERLHNGNAHLRLDLDGSDVCNLVHVLHHGVILLAAGQLHPHTPPVRHHMRVGHNEPIRRHQETRAIGDGHITARKGVPARWAQVRKGWEGPGGNWWGLRVRGPAGARQSGAEAGDSEDVWATARWGRLLHTPMEGPHLENPHKHAHNRGTSRKNQASAHNGKGTIPLGLRRRGGKLK